MLEAGPGGLITGGVTAIGVGSIAHIDSITNTYLGTTSGPPLIATSNRAENGGIAKTVVDNAGSIAVGNTYAHTGYATLQSSSGSAVFGSVGAQTDMGYGASLTGYLGGSVVFGYASAAGTGLAGVSSTGGASLAVGAAIANFSAIDTQAYVSATGSAAVALGIAEASTGAYAEIAVPSTGGFAHGTAYAQDLGVATIETTVAGEFVSGDAFATGAGSVAILTAGSSGTVLGAATASGGFEARVEAAGGFAVGSATATVANASVNASGIGAFALGRAVDGSITASGIGAAAGGYANGGSLVTSGNAGFTWGQADQTGAGASTIESIEAFGAGGGHAGGYANATDVGTATIRASGPGIASGDAHSFGVGNALLHADYSSCVIGSVLASFLDSSVLATGQSSLALGYAENASILASGSGALAGGNVAVVDVDSVATLDATGFASVAFGSVLADTGGVAGISSLANGWVQGDATASGVGSEARVRLLFAGGVAHGLVNAAGGFAALVESDGGGVVFGKADAVAANASVAANYPGSFAVGSVVDGFCIADAINSAQFGPGTNAEPNSVQIGSAGIRLLGTAAAAGTPQDGDIRVDGTGRLILRSGGVDWTLVQSAAYTPTNVTPDRSFDATTALPGEIANVLGTLIADLQAIGILS